MNLPTALIGAASLLIASACPTIACSVAPKYDPYRTVEQFGREDIVKKAEVIVEGVVEHVSPDPDDSSGFSRMHIDRVWKGDVGSDVVVIFTFHGADCSQAPPFGKRIRFGVRLGRKDPLLVQDAIRMTSTRDQLMQAHEDFLLYNARTAFDLPLQDPELDRLLLAYQTETAALKQRADTGDRAARLAYAAHLFDNNERHRSLAAYEALLRDDPADLDLLLTLAVVRGQVHPDDEPEATLAVVERDAPRTPEWQRKIMHARFVASGRLTPGWKDWSDLKPAVHCEVSRGDFDDASFDRADMRTCEFVGSSFRDASFLGADLSDAYFEDSNLTGAKYNCATKLPNDLDPVAAGMVNVDRTCPSP